METQMKLLAANLENRQKSKQELSQKQQSLQNELTDKQKARISLFGEKNPAEEEVRLNRQIDEAQTQEKASREKYDISHQKAQATETRIKTLIDNLEKRTPELEKAESAFRNDCQAKGFYEEAAFLAARVPDKERIALEKKAREQDEERTALSARKKDRQEQLTTETAKALTALSMTELTEQSARLNAAMKEVRDTMAGIRNRLQDNEQAKKRILAKQQLIDLQQQTYDRWNMLHALIGSNDGKKYPNFAQGLTFELMIAYANAQLQKMSDRYLLVRNKDKPLELDVIDNYQAGEIRSTRNLSGGECFIVSLSLALGLSSMASRHVRVDSLFLDEGFGTLDDNALETALDTLASLQQNGKLISIISHVSALKDRIRTQIKVIPGKGGKSRIEGPGCSRQSYA